MTLAARRALAARRLAALGLTVPLPDRSPAAVARALGALQAQDLTSGLWSIGVRTGGSLAEVLAAVDRGELVRTWPMRGTLHWVAAEDAGWLTRLCAGPAIRAATRVRASLGLSDEIVEQAGEVWAAYLATAGTMTRAEAATVLSENGIDASGQRCYHLLVRWSQAGLLVQGPVRRTPTGAFEPLFVLLDRWVGAPRRPERVEAMALLVDRYVRGHGPVTERDVAGWCDQNLGFVRDAVSATEGRVVREDIAGTTHLVHRDAPPVPSVVGPVLLLPGFDEWLLGYKDRGAQLTRDQERVVVPGGNGVFRGTLVAGSLVVGTWRRITSPRSMTIEVTPFGPVSTRVRRGADDAAATYGDFWGRSARVVWS